MAAAESVASVFSAAFAGVFARPGGVFLGFNSWMPKVIAVSSAFQAGVRAEAIDIPVGNDESFAGSKMIFSGAPDPLNPRKATSE